MRILVVEDHPQARDNLIRLCERSEDVQVVGAAACGAAGIDAAARLQPDIMLLDVQLPDMSGFQFLRAVGAGVSPMGILVSRGADQALSAFEEGVIDYLVTPVSTQRFDQAMTRARLRINSSPTGDGHMTSTTLEHDRAMRASPRLLVGERRKRLYPLDPRSIDYIEADGNYVMLRAGNVEYLSRDSIKRLAVQLAELGFIRIDRSLLVNAAAVLYAEVAGHGTYALTLGCGACLRSSAAYRHSILRIIPLPALSKRYRGTIS